jgi:hypothetical protein
VNGVGAAVDAAAVDAAIARVACCGLRLPKEHLFDLMPLAARTCHILQHRVRCQYVYFCTSKARKAAKQLPPPRAKRLFVATC